MLKSAITLQKIALPTEQREFVKIVSLGKFLAVRNTALDKNVCIFKASMQLVQLYIHNSCLVNYSNFIYM